MPEAAKGKVYPVHNNKFKFGIEGTSSSEDKMAMPADLENFAPAIDGTVEAWMPKDGQRRL